MHFVPLYDIFNMIYDILYNIDTSGTELEVELNRIMQDI